MPTIPDAEIEAGAKALREFRGYKQFLWDEITEIERIHWRAQARIVLTAAALVREQDNG